MNTDCDTDLKTVFVGVVVLALLAVVPVSAVAGQQQVDKELDERLLYLLSQRQTPPIEVVQQLLDNDKHATWHPPKGWRYTPRFSI